MTDNPVAVESEDLRTPLLSPTLLAKLERLQLRNRRPLLGRLSGEHRSPAYGSSIDFADYREYHPGDDFRRIDYALLARLDQLLIRLFEAEDDLEIRLLIDTSASMAFGEKFDQALRVAAALGFVALTRRDVVSLHYTPMKLLAPRFRGRGGVPALFKHLTSLQPSGETAFAAAAGGVLARPGPPGITVVLSDLLTTEWKDGVRSLPGRGGEVVVVHILSEEDLRPNRADDLAGDLDLVDVETGTRVSVSLNADLLNAYERETQQWVDEVSGRCRQAGVGYLSVMAGDDVEQLMLTSWRDAGLLR